MKKRILNFLCVALTATVLGACSGDDSSSSFSSPSTTDRSPAPSGEGKGGSMARFAISGNYLYTVDDRNLKLFDISTPRQPQYMQDVTLGIGVETIFPRKNNLFIGTQNGMFIVDVTIPNSPQILSNYWHVFSCDPVVADDNYAYVTLRSGTPCRQNFVNRLEVVDISNLRNPFMVREYPMTNPKGLGIDKDKLFICDNGLKVYDATDPMQLQQKNFFDIKSFDVIPNNGNLIVTGSDGLYQYNYANNSMELLSLIRVTPTK